MEPQATAVAVAKQWHVISRNPLEAYSDGDFSDIITDLEPYVEELHYRSVNVSSRKQSTEPHPLRVAIKDIILENYNSLTDFARTINMNVATLKGFLSTTTRPTSNSIHKYCNYLGIDLETLYEKAY